MKILVIDDYKNIKADYIARTFEDGVRKLRSEKWDLLYIDHNLGEFKKSGYDIMVFLKENKQYIPKMIICISDSPDGELLINGMIKDIYGRTFNNQEVSELLKNEASEERI